MNYLRIGLGVAADVVGVAAYQKRKKNRNQHFDPEPVLKIPNKCVSLSYSLSQPADPPIQHHILDMTDHSYLSHHLTQFINQLQLDLEQDENHVKNVLTEVIQYYQPNKLYLSYNDINWLELTIHKKGGFLQPPVHLTITNG